MTIGKGKVRIMVTFPQDLVEWLDEQAAGRDRSRSWVVLEVCRRWKRASDRQRKKQAQEARQAAKLILGAKARKG